MRSSNLSVSLRFTAVALMFGLIGAVHAAEARQLPAAPATAQNNQQAIASKTLETHTDWNIDYPSQLGPEGPGAATLAESPKDTSLAQQAASR